MATGLYKGSSDIDEIYETFDTSVATTYGATDSKFTDGSRFYKGSTILKDAIGKTIPTSAGADYLGGYNVSTWYANTTIPIDVALKGCRPIGILLSELTSGTHYINRVNGKTWLSNSPNSGNSATDTHLSYDPKYLHIELQAGGGGGGGGSTLGRHGAGGGGGGLVYYACTLVENSYIKLVVGAGGARGENASNASAGENSYIENASGTILASAYGGGGGTYNGAGGTGGSGAGTVVLSGGAGGGENNEAGENVAASTITISKPDTPNTWIYSAYNGGASGTISTYAGGGGGASHFANGAAGKNGKPNEEGTLGSGGAGGGSLSKQPGSRGGNGFIKIYY